MGYQAVKSLTKVHWLWNIVAFLAVLAPVAGTALWMEDNGEDTTSQE